MKTNCIIYALRIMGIYVTPAPVIEYVKRNETKPQPLVANPPFTVTPVTPTKDDA